MTKETAIKVFNEKQIRTHWDDENEKWYFSIVDVVGVLSESENPNNYWKVLKNRLKKEGSELVTNCNQLKMQSSDGKFYKTDVADTEQLFKKITKKNYNFIKKENKGEWRVYKLALLDMLTCRSSVFKN